MCSFTCQGLHCPVKTVNNMKYTCSQHSKKHVFSHTGELLWWSYRHTCQEQRVSKTSTKATAKVLRRSFHMPKSQATLPYFYKDWLFFTMPESIMYLEPDYSLSSSSWNLTSWFLSSQQMKTKREKARLTARQVQWEQSSKEAIT